MRCFPVARNRADNRFGFAASLQSAISMSCSAHQSRKACSFALFSKACQRSMAPRLASRDLNFW
jgi:hypothetical protein